MSARRLVGALLIAFSVTPAAFAEAWDPGELAEAEKLRAAEAARAAAYRERVARGDVRAAAAPMPREAPQKPGDPSAGEALRDAADLVDLLERWFGGEGEADAAREPRREELRQRERERRQPGADPWWEEEERRTRGPR